MLQNATNSGLHQTAIGIQAGVNQATHCSEIEGEMLVLRQGLNELEAALGELTCRLYQVVAPEAPEKCATASPRPVLNSPLGEALRVESDRIEGMRFHVDRLRARVQL